MRIKSEERLANLNRQIAQARELKRWWDSRPKILDELVAKNLQRKEVSWLAAKNEQEAEVIRQRAIALSEFSSLINKAIKAGEVAQEAVKQILESEDSPKN